MSKVIFDVSPPGTAKTTVVGRISEWYGTGEDINSRPNRVVLLVQSPRKHPNVEDFFIILEGRRGELTLEGGSVLEPNCILWQEANVLVNKGFTAEKLCRHCLGRGNCEFKFSRLNAEFQNIILNPGSHHLKRGDIVFLDEGTNTIPLLQSITITRNDVNAYIIALSELIENLTASNLEEADRVDLQSKAQKAINLLEMYLNVVAMIETNRIEEGNSIFNSLKDLIAGEEITIKGIKAINSYFIENEMGVSPDSIEELPVNFIEKLIKLIRSPDKYGYYFVEGGASAGHLKIYYLNPRWQEFISRLRNNKIPLLYIMDATPDRFLQMLLNANGIEYEIVGYDYEKPKPKVIQIVDYLNTRTHSTYDEKFKAFLIKLAATKRKKIGVITYSIKEQELKQFLESKGIADKFILGHWGADSRATNKYQECDTLLIWGRYAMNPNDTEAQFKSLSYHLRHEVDASTEGKVIMYNDNSAYTTKRYNQYEYEWFVREMKQAVGRICRGSYQPVDEPEVYIFTKYPYPGADEFKTYADIVEYCEYASDKQLARDKRNSKDDTKEQARLEKIFNSLTAKLGKGPNVRIFREKAKISQEKACQFLNERRG